MINVDRNEPLIAKDTSHAKEETVEQKKASIEPKAKSSIFVDQKTGNKYLITQVTRGRSTVEAIGKAE